MTDEELSRKIAEFLDLACQVCGHSWAAHHGHTQRVGGRTPDHCAVACLEECRSYGEPDCVTDRAMTVMLLERLLLAGWLLGYIPDTPEIGEISGFSAVPPAGTRRDDVVGASLGRVVAGAFAKAKRLI